MQKWIVFRSGFGLMGWVALAIAGCGGRSQSTVRPMEIASNAGSQAVATLDANKDGVLDYAELAKAPGLRAGVPTIKKLVNPRSPAPPATQLQTQKISAEEIDARIKQWKEAGAGRITVPCHVYRVNKKATSKPARQPIIDAEVKFVPESYLGAGLTTGTGTTDASGLAVISQPSRGGDDPSMGMSPGFYRVEITKGSEIPAKYNSETILGEEVAGDAAKMSSGGGIIFELEY